MIKFIETSLIVISLLLIIPNNNYGQEVSDADSLSYKKTITFEGRYFKARRSSFSDLYGDTYTLSIDFEKRYSNKHGMGYRLNFTRPASDLLEINLYNISIAPYITYTVSEKQNPRIFVGSGIGISYHRLNANIVRRDPSGQDLGILSISQNKISMFFIISQGIDFKASKNTILGFRLYYDYHMSGDPTRGDFGDTGGFHLMGRLGFIL